jgi:carboxypeptidase Taq
MAGMGAYDELIELQRRLHVLESVGELLAWDQETMMPAGGIEHRSRQMSLLAGLAHERATDPKIGELLSACEDDGLGTGPSGSDDRAPSANVRELRRRYDRLTKLPAALVSELAETTSLAQHEWARARERSDFGRFRPWLEKLVRLVRRKAECIGSPEGGEPWDALVDAYEFGARAADLRVLFAPLRERLSALIDELRTRGTRPDRAFNAVKLPIDRQEAFVRFVTERMGFDYARGRLDRSAHPFCSGTHPGDVRITTRFRDDLMCDALGSTMHEAGHGIYEQGLPPEHAGTPLGEAVSLGIHESQSRLWENHVGRSLAFWRWCQPQLGRFFGSALDAFDVERAYRAVNVVEPSLIRVEADEATYSLHVMVRFEIELDLVRGELEVADVPARWNALYRDYLGVEVPDDRQGCLQDVHWSCGLFGYFPTYALGNLYAAQLFAAAERAIPDLTEQFARGEFAALAAWLGEHVHAHGMRYPAGELCRRATGAELGAEAYLSHLSDKLRGVYRC